MRPARARHTISSPARRAIAAPVARGQMLSALCNSADGGLQVQFRGMDLDFVVHRYSTKSRGWVRGVGDAKLAALRERRHARMIRRYSDALGIRNSAEQVAYQAIKLAYR